MIPGLSGSLLSHDALSGGSGLPPAIEDARASAVRGRLRAWHRAALRDLGPACNARALYDRVAVPLLGELGFGMRLVGGDTGEVLRAVLHASGRPAAAVLVTAWGVEPGRAWRDAVRLGIGSSVRWCLCINGRVVRVMDARRTYSRRFLEFDMAATVEDATGFAIFWRLLSAAAVSRLPRPMLDEAVRMTEAHRSAVRSCLQRGVHDALERLVSAFASVRGRRSDLPVSVFFDESLIVVYRILFLLFAEARGLVPKWHPTYRRSYTIESLRLPIELQSRPPGVWETLQAISRLAHRGCRAGSLRVVPFNGRLFSPADAPLADSVMLDDGAVREVLLALTTRADRAGRQRIAYADLGVEQLGGVYERLLDFQPVWVDRQRAALTLAPAGRRKAAGAFYTPRALTEYLVRRTLGPLVREASADRILSLRVLDPAMGSGAFLVAACRYLARAYEDALIGEGRADPGDLSEPERAGFRRMVAERCLFGVDINPTAVQLGRLSLWLATMSADRPLTFLDHHLRTGNSLSGASLADVARQPPSARGSAVRAARLPLFEGDAADQAIGETISTRLSIATGPGDTLEQVRAKERLMASLISEAAPLGRWKRAADLWCAGWFEDRRPSNGRAEGALFGALLDTVLERGAVLPERTSSRLLERARTAARRERFFHWTLEFPEVFHEADGTALAAPGFDAVVGNPPWEMLRGERAAEEGAGLSEFARGSGVYVLQGQGHANLFQLFLERVLTLVRSGGRIGVLLPSGFASDHGCASLRRHLLDRTMVDTFVSVENRDGLFPIHRALKFLLITATPGASTPVLSCRFGVRSPEVLEELPDTGQDRHAVEVHRSLMTQLSGEQSAVPELRTAQDVAIAAKIAFAMPPLHGPAGWNVAFGRELNASDDRRHFVERPRPDAPALGPRAGHYPIIEGKQIQPFRVDVAASRFSVPARVAATLLDPRRTFAHPRLAYRDVASSTNRLTLIAAIIPARAITTHTLFCLKGNVEPALQQFLCAVFNSFVANYLVRLRVGMHVTVSIIEHLRVPVVACDASAFRQIAGLAASLGRGRADGCAAAILQARVARLYGLSRTEFHHVLGTFPLIPLEEREAAAAAFEQPEDAGRPSSKPRRPRLE